MNYHCDPKKVSEREFEIDLITQEWRNKVERLVTLVEDLLPLVQRGMALSEPPEVVKRAEQWVEEYRKAHKP